MFTYRPPKFTSPQAKDGKIILIKSVDAANMISSEAQSAWWTPGGMLNLYVNVDRRFAADRGPHLNVQWLSQN